ncbi:hypothetical protein HPB48_019057 [Haemaphysalis longicornis]|uniref:ABC-2 type transporter transmembrane domain-containing protein n=1 Tax=Haemaphysalis longicornis TaxID=44386 RepID=A0A9J6GMG5_HAELO|nr:hypothetical protein HPB48_019057 [Haemaphysalis longicornis]
MLLFSGFVVTLRAMPSYLHWISYLSFVRYAYEGCMMTLYGYGRPEMPCNDEDDSTGPCLFTDPMEFIHFLGLNVITVELCALALLVFVVLLNAATYLALRLRVKCAFG